MLTLSIRPVLARTKRTQPGLKFILLRQAEYTLLAVAAGLGVAATGQCFDGMVTAVLGTLIAPFLAEHTA